MNKKQKFYSVNQFLDYIGNCVTKAAVYQKIANGEIPVQHFGSRKLIPATWVDNFVNGAKYEKVAN